MTLALDFFEPVDSPLHRLDPRWKLLAVTLLAIAVAALGSLPCAVAAFVFVLALLPLGGVSVVGHVAQMLRILAFLMIFVIWLPLIAPASGQTWTLGPVTLSVRGTELAFLLVLKTATILTLVSLLLATAPLNDYVYAANALYVPGFMVHLALLTYRYLFVLASELAALRVAVRMRAYRNRLSLHCYRTIGHLTGALLVRSSDRAERVNHAMRCRAYHGRFHALAEFRTRTRDVICFFAAVAVAATLIGWDITRRG